jgi:hypothetical protein
MPGAALSMHRGWRCAGRFEARGLQRAASRRVGHRLTRRAPPRPLTDALPRRAWPPPQPPWPPAGRGDPHGTGGAGWATLLCTPGHTSAQSKRLRSRRRHCGPQVFPGLTFPTHTKSLSTPTTAPPTVPTANHQLPTNQPPPPAAAPAPAAPPRAPAAPGAARWPPRRRRAAPAGPAALERPRSGPRPLTPYDGWLQGP